MTLYILDSDHLSLLQQGNKAIKNKLALILLQHDIAITAITVEELLRGRLAQIRRAKQMAARVSAFYWLEATLEHLCQFTVLGCTEEAEAWVRLWRSQKIRIGSQDLRIASICLANNAMLITRNKKDFCQIPKLIIESWV